MLISLKLTTTTKNQQQSSLPKQHSCTCTHKCIHMIACHPDTGVSLSTAMKWPLLFRYFIFKNYGCVCCAVPCSGQKGALDHLEQDLGVVVGAGNQGSFLTAVRTLNLRAISPAPSATSFMVCEEASQRAVFYCLRTG